MQALGTRRESQRGEEDKTTTTTTARAQVKGRALTPESVLLGLVDLVFLLFLYIYFLISSYSSSNSY